MKLDKLTPQEQLEYLKKGTEQIEKEDELLKKLERSYKTGKPLKVKVGFDPSAPDIHLGHTVVLRKMKHYQDLGHTVVFLIGDFTGLIGDPSGKKATRPQLNKEQVLENAETYKQQCFKILDPEKTVIDFNSRWLNELGSEGWIRLAAKYTVAQMMTRDDFRNRWEKQLPISIHELLYPLAQGYDSVFLEADVELGGTDQTFNLLVGRDLMREYNLEPQVIMTLPLLEGTDGVDKMSKSLNNYIAIEDTPKEIFGKVMSISDEMMYRYYELCTDTQMDEITAIKKAVASGELHPMAAKTNLAKLIIKDFHNTAAADTAEEEFRAVFSDGGVPDDIEEFRIKIGTEAEPLFKLIARSSAAKSNSDARRLMQASAVSVDDEKVSDLGFEIDYSAPGEYIVKVGKRRFIKYIVG
ncbi:MAG: tyrosine--tRNA ligase [Acidobacteria bacterium]|nr:tyrosine--tRNA ligase [Acidobacteriota bacterium]